MKSIKNIDDLLTIAKSEDIELANDIDAAGRHITKLCPLFKGTIEGNNHTVSNIVIDDPIWGDEQKIALFGYLSHARIKNIRFENVSFIIDKGVYSPNIAGLAIEVSDSQLENITMSVITSNGNSIPMIFESIGGTNKALNYTCNNKEYKKYQYKEGSLYEGIN